MNTFNPRMIEAARSKGELPCQVELLATIRAGIERYGYFHSDPLPNGGTLGIAHDRAMPVLEALARDGWHVIWAHMWERRETMSQHNKDFIKFSIAAEAPRFWCGFVGGTVAYRLTPNPNDPHKFTESGPFDVFNTDCKIGRG